MRKIVLLASAVAISGIAQADGTYWNLGGGNLMQNWTNIGQISVSDDWSGVASFNGFRGDNLTALTGVDPQTVPAADDPGVLDVNANQTNPDTFVTGGLAEFEIAIPVVALN